MMIDTLGKGIDDYIESQDNGSGSFVKTVNPNFSRATPSQISM